MTSLSFCQTTNTSGSDEELTSGVAGPACFSLTALAKAGEVKNYGLTSYVVQATGDY